MLNKNRTFSKRDPLTANEITFYVISGCLLVPAVLAVTTRKIFRAAIWLLFSLVGVAALYFWMEVEFIAAVQIVVYVGGIVVLIIFSVFLTQQTGKEMTRAPLVRIISAVFAVLLGFLLTWLQINHAAFTPAGKPFNWDVQNIGSQMLSTGKSGYALPFEAVSILLLAAMVGCIVIALKSPDHSSNNHPTDNHSPNKNNIE